MELGFSEIRVYRIPENWHGKMMIDHIKPPNFLGSWLNVSLNRIYSYLIIFILWSLGLITMILAESCYDWFPKNPMVDVVGHHFLMKSIDLHHWMWRGWLFKSAWDCSIEACRPKSGCPYDMDLLSAPTPIFFNGYERLGRSQSSSWEVRFSYQQVFRLWVPGVRAHTHFEANE